MTEAPAAQTSRNGGIALAVICVAQLMVILDATVVNVALPRIRHDLHFSPRQPHLGHHCVLADLRRPSPVRRPHR